MLYKDEVLSDLYDDLYCKNMNCEMYEEDMNIVESYRNGDFSNEKRVKELMKEFLEVYQYDNPYN